MKKNHLLSAVAVILAASVSCSRFEEGLNNDGSEGSALDLSIMMYGKETKGLITGNSLPEDSEVGLALYGTDGEVYDNLPYTNVMFTSTGNGTSQTWKPEIDVMLSASEAVLYAYYPYSSEVTDVMSIPVTASSEIQTDYLYAAPVSGLDNNSPKADITMHHALAAIRLSMKRGTYSGTGNVTSISVKGEGIATEGILNAMDGTISSASGTETEVSPSMEAFTLSSDLQGNDIIVIPASTGKSIEMKITIDGEEFSLTTSPVTLEAGKIAVYEATVNNAEISLSSVKIADWSYNAAGTPIIRNEWTISLEGDINDISFANSIKDDGSIQIIAVPIPLEASVDPVSVVGDVTVSEETDLERGTRTIILTDIRSDVTVTFDGLSLWTTATYNIENISGATQVINSYTINNINRMVVNGVEISPATAYQFDKTGEHTIRFSFVKHTGSGKHHIPELGFKDVSALVGVRIAEGYTLLKNQIFNGCKSLTSVLLPSTLTSMGYETFYKCSSLEEISFPDGITSFADSQCYDCSSLMKVKLPKGLKSLGRFTFRACSKLKEIEIPEGVTSIGYGAFRSSGVTSLWIPDGVSVIPEQMCMMCSSLTEIRLPASLNTIKYQALYECSQLERVIHADGTEETGTLNLPEGLESVKGLAICSIKFTSLHLPYTLTDIAPSGLANRNVETFTCSEANPVYEIRSNAVVEKSTNILVAGCRNSLIDESVTVIGSKAFYNSPISTVDLHEGITEIQSEAFTSASPSVIISRASTPPVLGSMPFWIGISYGTLKVPAEALDAYQEKWMIDEVGYIGNSINNWTIKALEDGE